MTLDAAAVAFGNLVFGERGQEPGGGGGSRMEWMLRLVGTGIVGQSRSFDVMAISGPDGLMVLARPAAVGYRTAGRPLS
jgi:hypothetical protein